MFRSLKLVSTVLAVVVISTLVVPAFAAEASPVENGGKPVISSVDNGKLSDAKTGSSQFSVSTLDEYAVNEGVSSRAALTDLNVFNLRSETYTPPFPLSTNIPFRFDVENATNVDAPAPILTVYMNGSLIGTTNLPTIPAYNGRTFGFNVGAAFSGNYTVTVKVNETQAIPESNYNNNQVSGIYTWGAGDTGLTAYAFNLTDNTPTFPVGSTKQFSMSVLNGSDISFNMVQVQIDIIADGVTTSSDILSIGSLPAHNIRQNLNFYITFPVPGNCTVRMTVLSPSGYTDPYPTDNVREINLVITP